MGVFRAQQQLVYNRTCEVQANTLEEAIILFNNGEGTYIDEPEFQYVYLDSDAYNVYEVG